MKELGCCSRDLISCLFIGSIKSCGSTGFNVLIYKTEVLPALPIAFKGSVLTCDFASNMMTDVLIR